MAMVAFASEISFIPVPFPVLMAAIIPDGQAAQATAGVEVRWCFFLPGFVVVSLAVLKGAASLQAGVVLQNTRGGC